MIDARGMGVVEFDYGKIITPTNFGYRDMNFTLRMPNGLMVEFQAIAQGIAEAKREYHKLFDKWRKYSEEQIMEMGRWEEYYADRQISYAGYNNAWRSDLNRGGISHGELIKSLMKDFTTLGLVSTPITSSASAGDTNLLGSQTPSAERKNGMVGVPSSTLLPSRSSVRNTSDNFISTSSDKISQSSDNATFSQGKSLVADTENLNNETEVRYRLESGDNKYAFNIMEGYKPTNTVKGYKAFVRDKDGNLKPLFVSNDISIPIGKWLEAKETWHFQAENGLYYVPTGGEDVEAKKSKKKKDEKKTGENILIPNEKVRAELKPELHKIYSKWRGMSRSQIVDSGKWEERYSDQQRSYAGYNNAWRSALKRWGISHEELTRSLMKDFTTLGLSSTPNNSHSSSTVMSPPTSQAPSEFLKNGSLGVSKQTLLPSRSVETITSDNFISTSSDKISQSSDNATFSQGKSDPAAKDFVAGYKESPKIANPLTENCKCQNIYISKNPIASIRNPYLYIAYIITGLFS